MSAGTPTKGRIEFRALGTLDLRGPDGRRIDTLLSQPKRVALLAYLAAARPHGLHSRDRLAALFSPEADQPHARQALRQALSVLRSELGEGAIVTVGDGEVGLDVSAVWCDVAAFDEAVATGRHAEALDVYRGEFLSAFFLSGAPDFEAWLESERARLKRDASACARALTDHWEAGGDYAAAAIWARRARQLAPEDEVVLRRLIQVLDRVGDRVGALRVYDEFADWLKREYDVDPAPETRALIEATRKREGPTPSVERKHREPAPAPSAPPATKPPLRIPRGVVAGGALLLAIGLAVRLVGRVRPSCVWIDEVKLEDRKVPPGLGDSLAHRIASRLSGFPDFVTKPPGERCPFRSSVVRQVTGTVKADGHAVFVEVHLEGEGAVGARGAEGEWRTVADTVAEQLLGQILRSPIDPSVPFAVMPKSPEGWKAFLKAERLFAEGRWTAAGGEYARAQSVDPTCYLCSWRMNELGRWLRKDLDPALTPSYLAHIGAFPSHYQRLIHSTLVPLRDSFDTLRVAVQSSPSFFLGWFMLGDELFHRGSLVGHGRTEAIEAFLETTKLRPDFAPAWEHLAWAQSLEGDSGQAYKALDSLQRLRPAQDLFARAVDAMVTVGVAWRFAPPARAMALTATFVNDPELSALVVLPAGPRYVPTFGAPRGAVEFGRYFAGDYARGHDRPDVVPSALIAQVFGHLALGHPDSARVVARELAAQKPTADYELFVRELDAAVFLLDASAEKMGTQWTEAADALTQLAQAHNVSEGVRQRAAWALTLAARRVGGPSGGLGALLDQEPPPQPLRRLLIADAQARSGHFKEALEASNSLTELRAGSLVVHAPFFRAVLHLLRADWYRQLGNDHDARAELLWYQNLDDRGWLMYEPQMAEGDWAFGTLAQWRIARLLDSADDRRGACRAYGEVIRLWSAGEAAYTARADTARRRLTALGC